MCRQITILFMLWALGGCMEPKEGSYVDLSSPMTGDVRFVHKVWSVTADGTVVPHGGGCERLGSSAGTSEVGGFDVGEDGRYVSMSMKSGKDAVNVEISYNDEVVYENTFDEMSLYKGEIEEYSFTTPDGTTFFFQFFGADSCDVDYLDFGDLDAGTS